VDANHVTDWTSQCPLAAILQKVKAAATIFTAGECMHEVLLHG